jgi:hypothetical protein
VNRWGPAVCILGAIAFFAADRMGLLWFGLPTATLVGLMMLLAPVFGVIALLIVVWDRLNQLLARWNDHERRLRDLEGWGKVRKGPWRKSG